jgi:redox-sensitive bicupin YhaK (pirin superfamily)
MNYTITRADERGSADHGWLKPKFSFSFSNYYNPHRMGFGALRVLNDDWIAGNQGFGTHPHDNMEIITIPFSGALHHKDSIGNEGTILPGQIQIMSAGTGILHSEFNPLDEPCTLFQIWIHPNERNVEPRYDQTTFDPEKFKNRFQQLVSPDPNDEGAWIHQDAWINRGKWDKKASIEYPLMNKANGVFIIVIDGEIEINGETLQKRDSIEIVGEERIILNTGEYSDILVIEVPMK